MRFRVKSATINYLVKSVYWFAVGFILSAALLSSAVLFYFQYAYKDRVIPGVFIDNIYIGEQTKAQIEKTFNEKNEGIGKNSFIFTAREISATISAKSLDAGYDVDLITNQALSLGKTKNLLSDAYLILSSFVNGTFLTGPSSYDSNKLEKELSPIRKAVTREPVDAEFKISGNKVVAFRQSSDGESLDFEMLDQEVKKVIPQLIRTSPGIYSINVPIKKTKPQVTTEEANDMGIVEPIGTGRSTFYHSIPSRVHNVGVATSKINGVIVEPGEEFSFVKMIGDISKFTGYQQAYIIQGGKTVLGDGGGVCQVSTTLFRAVLNAGLPVVERHAHAYRVGYYEQDQPPGYDATTFVPTVDFRFKNDTGKHIFIEALADMDNLSLTFTIYGKSDGRQVSITKPVISNVSSAPPDLYQDDPTLPVGTVKQVDFAAPGARSVFSRTVTRNGETIIKDTFVSNYKPWQAVFLKGTKI